MRENDKLRIAVIGTRGFPGLQGGVERHCEELYTRLAANGAIVEVFARKGYIDDEQSYHGVKITPTWAPRKKNLEAITHTFLCTIRIILNRQKYDIVHVHAIGPSLVIPLLKLFKIPVVMTHHGKDYDRQKWGIFAKTALRLGEWLGMRQATRVIAVSHSLERLLANSYKRKLDYIPNGVTTYSGNGSRPDMLKYYGLTKGKYLLSVGRLVPEKGFYDLLKAFERVQFDWNLVIAGGANHDDDYTRSLRKLAANNKRVKMIGQVKASTIEQLYQGCGLLVVPSYHEGLSITLLEAMSYSVPCLVSDIPPNRELIKNKSLVFAPGNIEDMSVKIANLIKEPIDKNILDSYQKRIVKEFDWDHIAVLTQKVYTQVAGNGN